MSAMNRKSLSAFHTSRLEQFDASWRQRKLASGLVVLHAPLPHSDHFYLGVSLKTGSRLETGAHLPGVSHFLEHMMFRGSGRYPEFSRLAEAFEWLGGDWNAATGHEHTEYWYSGIRHSAPEVIDLFADFMANPQLTDLETERQIILRELDGETNDHGHSTDLDHHVAALIWPGTTIAQPILGTRESLGKIDRAALIRYRDDFYVPANMAVCAVGGPPETLDLLATHFGALRRSFSATPRVEYPALPKFHGPAVKWVEHSDNEYEIKLSFVCGGEWSEDAQVYELLSRILADGFCSRLARRLREELGLVYDISAYTSLGIEAGTLDVSASCAQEQIDEFLRELLALLKDLGRHGPTADEIQRTALRTIVDMELAPTIPEIVGARLPWAELASRRLSLVADRERVKAVTVERAAAVAKDLFRVENLALAVLGPAAKDLEKRLKKAVVAGLATD